MKFFENHTFLITNILIFIAFLSIVGLYLLFSYQRKIEKKKSSGKVIQELEKIAKLTKKNASKIRSTPINTLA